MPFDTKTKKMKFGNCTVFCMDGTLTGAHTQLSCFKVSNNWNNNGGNSHRVIKSKLIYDSLRLQFVRIESVHLVQSACKTGVSGNDFWTLGTGTGIAQPIPKFWERE